MQWAHSKQLFVYNIEIITSIYIIEYCLSYNLHTNIILGPIVEMEQCLLHGLEDYTCMALPPCFILLHNIVITHFCVKSPLGIF